MPKVSSQKKKVLKILNECVFQDFADDIISSRSARRAFESYEFNFFFSSKFADNSDLVGDFVLAISKRRGKRNAMPLSPRKGKRPMPFSRTKAAEAWTAAPSHSPAPSRPSSSLSTLIKRIQGIEKNEGRSDRETCLPDSCSQPSQHSARYGSSGTVPPHDCATVKQQGALGNDRDESHGPTKTFQTKQTASAIEHKKSAQTQSHSRSQERPESSLWR